MADLLDLTPDLPDRRYRAGDVVVAEGDPAGSLWVLVEGSLEIRKGSVSISTITTPGACIGEVGLLNVTPATATVVATTATRMRVAADGMAFLLGSPDVLVAVARMLAGRLDLVTSYLADLEAQYRGEPGLAMVGEVLDTLTRHGLPPIHPGSAREPEPPY